MNTRGWSPWHSSQIMHVGTVAALSTTGGVITFPTNVIRARLVICYECMTGVQFIPCWDSPMNPTVMAYIKSIMDDKSIPTSMENLTHEDIVKWSTLPLDIINANLPKFSDTMSLAKPILKWFGL